MSRLFVAGFFTVILHGILLLVADVFLPANSSPSVKFAPMELHISVLEPLSKDIPEVTKPQKSPQKQKLEAAQQLVQVPVQEPVQGSSAETLEGNAEAVDNSGAGDNFTMDYPLDSPVVPEEDLTQGRIFTKPEYPNAARRLGYQGVVKAEIFIDPQGAVRDVKILASSGHGILDGTVIETVKKKWRFNPLGRELTLIREFQFSLTSPRRL